MATGDFSVRRGADVEQPFQITLDESRTLDGTETWRFVLRTGKDGSTELLELTSPAASGIRIESGTFYPTVIFAPTTFSSTTNFPRTAKDTDYYYDLEMTKDGKIDLFPAAGPRVMTLVGNIAQ